MVVMSVRDYAQSSTSVCRGENGHRAKYRIKKCCKGRTNPIVQEETEDEGT